MVQIWFMFYILWQKFFAFIICDIELAACNKYKDIGLVFFMLAYFAYSCIIFFVEYWYPILLRYLSFSIFISYLVGHPSSIALAGPFISKAEDERELFAH